MPILRTGATPSCLIVEPPPFPRPRFWSTVWSLYAGSSLAESTLTGRLRYIDHLYLYCDREYGKQALDSALGEKNAERLHEMFLGFYVELTTKQASTTADVKSWDAVSGFLQFFAKHWAVNDEKWRALQIAIPQPGSVRDSRKGKVRFTRSLPDVTLRDLLAVAKPGAATNPFSSPAIQIRNYLLVLLMLVVGLRRGENLLLTLDSIKQDVDMETGGIKHWLDVTDTPEEDNVYIDKRATRPSIKTNASHRQIPISENLAELIELHISEFRADSTKHQFLITSHTGQPLSAESVTKAMRQYSKAMTPEAMKAFRQRTKKEHISPHDLRHTSACVMYTFFMADGDKEKTFGRMRSFFGWSKESDMPDTYARAAIEDDVKNSVSQTFDAMLQIVRGQK